MIERATIGRYNIETTYYQIINSVKTYCSNSVSFKGSYYVPTLTYGASLSDANILSIGPFPDAATMH